ncbi:bifunctional cytochrome P450/NADPH--P450 reductase [Bacillus sp. FJAT-42376]|uniref:bifunctional cytochrome P450/NADPH--P450 reductase n=1 Tax=Bacillus sp. FJAT-42376 TaxID=2014076 RepID=UPI0024065B86|nr:bifunctional cytochrome P450/NADPH--P450 reductase [Bacillus sp. FJAT-42376]
MPELQGAYGHLPLLNPAKPVQSLMKIAEKMGPVFRFEKLSRSAVYVSGHTLAAEVSDESRFDKSVSQALQNVRAFSGDGLFTSWTKEPNWKKAHNILLPSFSQRAMKGYHSMMADIAIQLVQKWERLNAGDSIDVADDMTRLTLDTIGLCGFNYRFNSYYRQDFHPFIDSMTGALGEAMSKLQRTETDETYLKEKEKAFQKNIQSMFSLVDQLIAERKQLGKEEWPDDLLSHMLRSIDPESGEGLDDENIRFQIITFLIAGHETTSGLLSFAFYYLLKNPGALKKAQEEADRVLTSSVPAFKEVKKLKYVQMILNETLRLWPTAPAFSLYAKEDDVIGGEYAISKGEEVTILLPQLHRDPSVWGGDADQFKPERFDDMSRIPQHAFKPFGNGQRACIGQQFALHEAALVMGMLLKHFDFTDHTNYELEVKETLTLKPDHFTMKVKSRKPFTGFGVQAEEPPKKETTVAFLQPAEDAHQTPMLVLYGSNMGTSEGLAKELAEKGIRYGFKAEAAPLDAYAGKLPKEGAVVVLSASYNGNPPDNAVKFTDWLEGADPDELEGVHYTVFGCGDRNWASTYQRIPHLIDAAMEAKGAVRVAERGEGDADADFEGDYEAWENQLWASIAARFGIDLPIENTSDGPALSVEFVSGEMAPPIASGYGAITAEVAAVKELQSEESGRSTRHIEFLLPDGIGYKEGGHIGIFPKNSPELVNRVLRRFQLNGHEQLVLSGEGAGTSHLPKGRPVGVRELFTNFVEFQEPVTRSQLKILAAVNVCPPHRMELEAMLERYQEEILAKRVTMLELLEKYMACELSFEQFVGMLPALKPRYYSISSSPETSAGRVSLTVGVLKTAAWSGAGEYNGVASGYLSRLLPGDRVTCFVKEPQSGFERPANPETPLIMVGPGTGISPFRGFLQGRRALKEQGYKLGEAHLYFGCRARKHDYLYEQELIEAEQDGLVTLHTAFSREEGKEKTYVQHLIKENASHLLSLLEKKGHLYICGDGSKMAPAVENVLTEIYQTEKAVSAGEAASWLADLQQQGRFSKDVWAGK